MEFLFLSYLKNVPHNHHQVVNAKIKIAVKAEETIFTGAQPQIFHHTTYRELLRRCVNVASAEQRPSCSAGG